MIYGYESYRSAVHVTIQCMNRRKEQRYDDTVHESMKGTVL